MGKRHEAIERMKAITAEYLKDEKFTIENGTLDHAGIDEVNGVAVIDATVKFTNGGCSFGGRCVGQFNPQYKTIRGSRYGLEALLWLMAVTGVDHSHELGGQYVRVAFDKEGHAKYIGHIVKDIWFGFDDLDTGISAEERRRSEDPMERKTNTARLLNARITTRVENRLKAENVPYERIHDFIAVAPEHFAILQRITDEVMHEMVKQASTSTDVIRQRIQRKRELAEKCTRYYPVMQRCEGFAQQVAAAATVESAVTIKDMMERRNRSEEYFIGPRTIVFSDELTALEFEPTEFERAEMKIEAAYAAAKMNQSLQIDPGDIECQLDAFSKELPRGNNL